MRAVLLCAFSVALWGCSKQAPIKPPPAPSSTTTEIVLGPRTVKFVLDEPGTASIEGSNVILNFVGGKLIVEPERVTKAGQVLAKLPSDSKVVIFEFINGRASIKADGVEVLNPEKPK